MEVRAHLRHLRIAPRKVRLVIGLVRGRRVEQALDQLSILPKNAARPVLKLLQSAMANADHNFHLDPKSLTVKSIVANEGPRLKRYRPRAFGRAAEILKRSTHVTIVLEGQPAKTGRTAAAKIAKPVAVDTLPPSNTPAEPPVQTMTAKKEKPGTDQSKARDAQDPTIRRQGKE